MKTAKSETFAEQKKLRLAWNVYANDPYAVGQLTGFVITLFTPAAEAGEATKVANITKTSLRSASASIGKAAKLGLKSSVVEGVLTFSDDAGKALLTVEKVGDDLVCRGEVAATISSKEATRFVEGVINGVRKYNIAGEFANGATSVTRQITFEGKTITLKWTKTADGLIDFGNRSDLARLLGTIEDEAHHIVTWTKAGEHPVIQAAAEDGFHLNEFENGIGLSKYKKSINEGLHGNHPAYDDYVLYRLNNYQNLNPGFTPSAANEFIQKVLIPDMRDLIDNASKSILNLNEYFKQIVNPTIPK